MNKKRNVLLLTVLMGAGSLTAAPKKTDPVDNDRPKSAPSDLKRLKFENKENIALMEMLTKLVMMKRDQEISMLVRALASAQKADQLRLAQLEAEAFDVAAKKLVSEMLSFFELLSVVRSVVEESLQKSTIIDLQANYEGRKPFLIAALDMSRAEQEQKLEQATREVRREVILEVAAVLQVLKHNMGRSVKKTISPLVEQHLAKEVQGNLSPVSGTPRTNQDRKRGSVDTSAQNSDEIEA